MNPFSLVGQITAKINKFLTTIGFKNIAYYDMQENTIQLVSHQHKSLGQIVLLNSSQQAIFWSVKDFETRAKYHWDFYEERELLSRQFGDATSWKDVFDESKFEEALNIMISKHNAEYGITWDSVDFYLEEICSKKTK